ncbi:hypothetical protein JW979_15265 [bacterium]|nr:hypothetical protein [candidate division CSSED10-310 bacterium]
MKKSFLVFTAIMVFASISVLAEVSDERMESSMAVFAKGVDQLLIDTAHVYVIPSDTVKSLYLPGIGMLFLGEISMTSSGGIYFPSMKVIKLCDADKKEMKMDLSGIGSDISDALAKLSKLSELSELSELAKLGDETGHPELQKLSELSQLSELSELSELKILSNIGPALEKAVQMKAQISEEQIERLEQMDEHLSAFKKELVQTIIDYGPNLKGINDDEEIVCVFFVKEKEFKEKYGVSKFYVRVPYKKLLKIHDQLAEDPGVLKLFESNI